MEPAYCKSYTEEFVRVLAPGGCAVFHVSYGLRMPLEPGPDSACRAQIFIPEAYFKAELGCCLNPIACVRNTSPHRWPVCVAEEGGGAFNLGDHWLDISGSPVALDDASVALSKSLGPQEAIEHELTISVPSAPREYLLKQDMPLEGVCWSKDKGSTTTRLIVAAEQSKPHAQSPRAG
jgi:hypothetical protein